MQEVNDSNFETEVIEGSKGTVVLVDYYANTCNPCKRLMPKLENVSNITTVGKIVKVNVEDSFESSMRNMIKTIPTLAVYKDGKMIDIHRGCSQMSEDAIGKLLEL